MAILLATGCGDRQDAFDKHAPGRALGAETALAPHDCRPQRLFGGVVSRLHPVHTDKCPQRRPQPQQFSAQPLGLIVAPLARLQDGAHRSLHRLHTCHQCRAIDPPVPEGMPQRKQQLDLRQHVGCPSAQGIIPFVERQQIAQQMAPTESVIVRGGCLIRFQPVGTHRPAECAAQRGSNHLPAPAFCHMKEGRDRADHDPQPAAFPGLLPAGFVQDEVKYDVEAPV